MPLENQAGFLYFVFMHITRKLIISITTLFLFLLLIGCSNGSKDFVSLRQDGEKALGSGDYDGALEILRQAYHMNPSDRDILFYLGTVFRKLEQNDSSVAYFKRARILYPKDRDINRELLGVCRMTNDYDGAIRAIASLIATGDNEQTFWPMLAELYYMKKDVQGSLRYYKLLLEENPGEKNYYIQTSGIMAQLGQFQDANQILQKAIDKFGANPESYANMAINFLSLKDIAKGEEFFRKSLEIGPGNIPIWINLANVLSEQKDIVKRREALAIYKKYQKQTPEAFGVDSLIDVLEKEIGRQ